MKHFKKLQMQQEGQTEKVREVLKIVGELWDKAQKAEENYDHFLRAVADLDNYRKRAIKDRHHEVESAQIQLVGGLLPIIDNLERALTGIKGQSDSKGIQEGLQLIGRQLQSYLESVGLKPLNVVGEKFDPHKHEAVMHVQSKEHPDHTVLEEVQKGYALHGRVIRHALVKVVNNPATSSADTNIKQGNVPGVLEMPPDNYAS